MDLVKHVNMKLKKARSLIICMLLGTFGTSMLGNIPSRQISVPRTFPSNATRRSPKDPIWPSQGYPILTPRGRLNLKWCPGDVLIWRSRDVPKRTFKTRLRDNVGSSAECPKIYIYFSFGNLFDWPNLSQSNSTLEVY